MQDSMKLSLSAKQVEFKQKIIDDPTVVEACIGGSAGGAKTMSMCIAMLLAMSMYPGIQFALGRKTLQGLNRSTVATLLGKAHPMFGIGPNDFHYDKKDGTITYNDGSKITLLALDYEPSDPDFTRLGSAEFDWAFIDEAGEISRQAKDVLRSRLGRGIATQKYEIPPKIILSCIPEGGLVQTNSGYKPVEDVTDTDRLLCDDGTFSEIKQFFRRTVDEDIYQIKCANNALPLELTGNHPVFVSTPKKWKETFYLGGKQNQIYHLEQNFDFRPASEVKEGDWLRMPIVTTTIEYPYKWKSIGKAKMPCPFNIPDFWWFVGYWLGDGWSTNGQIMLSCDDKYPAIKDRLCNVIEAMGRTPNIFQNPSGSSTISFHSSQLEEFLHTQFGKGADKKHIPYWAQNHKNNLDIVDGFLDSDGCVTQCGNTVEFVSVNYLLLCGIQQILFKHNIISSSKHRAVAGITTICGRTVEQKDRYHLSFAYRDIREFAKHTSSTKMAQLYQPRAIKYNARRRTNCYIENGYVMFKVKKISTRHYAGTVYNFETVPHNYVASNFTCHNCNPSTNFLRTEYYQPYKELGAGGFQKWQIGEVIVHGKTLPAYRAFLRMSVKDNPFIDKNYYETLKQLPDRERKRLLDGDWDYSDNDRMLFTGELIEDCTIYEMPEMSMVEKYDYLMGVDVADVGCFDDRTEVLTDGGWKLFKDVKDSDRILTQNPTTGEATFEPHDGIHYQHYEGEMWNYDSPKISFSVTPNHKMLCRQAMQTNGNSLRSIEDIPWKEWKLVRTHKYKCNRALQEKFSFSSEVKMPNGGARQKTWEFDKNDWFSFLGWFISEGCVIEDSPNHLKICITQKAGTEKSKKIEQLLTKMGIRHTHINNDFVFYNNPIAQHLLEHVGKFAHNKRIPEYVTYSDDREAIDCFLTAYCNGDGCWRKERRLSYFTSSKHIADALQIILANINAAGKMTVAKKAGSEFSIDGRRAVRQHDVYCVNENHPTVDFTVGKMTKIRKEHYNGTIYCAITKHHTMFVRRNGTCYWTGNTDSSVISIVQNNILVRQIKINLRDAGIGKDSRVDVGDFLSEKVIFYAKQLGFGEKDARRITIETNGVGASLRDALRRKRWLVTEYTADTKSRSRMFYSLHELMVDGKVSIYKNADLNYDELRRQMTAHEYEIEGDRIKLTSKKDLRRQLGCSPDMADSFAIAMYSRGDAIESVTPKSINYFAKIRM